jgi:hypothetical protein
MYISKSDKIICDTIYLSVVFYSIGGIIIEIIIDIYMTIYLICILKNANKNASQLTLNVGSKRLLFIAVIFYD